MVYWLDFFVSKAVSIDLKFSRKTRIKYILTINNRCNLVNGIFSEATSLCLVVFLKGRAMSFHSEREPALQ